MEKNWLAELNNQQKLAVESISGPVLILAGAGTGKTKTVISRMGHILSQGNTKPNEILGLTFTNKAAREMRERLNNYIDIMDIWLGTFHSICVKLLRIYTREANLKPGFIIIDQSESEKIIKDIVKEINIDIEPKGYKKIKYILSSLKEKQINYYEEEKINTATYNLKDTIDISKIYKEYQQHLEKCNLLDFDDLILYATNLLTNNPSVLQHLQSKFKYIFVDEYQDTSGGQNKLIKLLADGHKNICCVGDEDQSIYSWRGADISNILNFPKTFKNSKVIRLEQNYRSTGNIIKTAMSVISNNKSRYSKELFVNAGNGSKVQIICTSDEQSESNKIATIINKLKTNENISLNNIAILVRASFQNRPIEEALNKHCIPYRVVDGIKFYDRKEIKDLIAYLRLTSSLMDELSFERIINTPRRGVGIKTLSDIKRYARFNNLTIMQALAEMLNNNSFSKKLKEMLQTFYEQINHWHREIKESYDLKILVEKIAHESGYIEMLKEESQEDKSQKDRINNIYELIDSLENFSSLDEFLEHVALVNSQDLNNDNNQVSIFTMHGAKGLEFDIVFSPGWEENIFPSAKSLEENDQSAIEEERRLAYVTITRAKEKLFLLNASSRFFFGRKQYNTISRFLSEIQKNTSEDAIEIINEKSSFERGKSFNNNYNKNPYKKHFENPSLQSTYTNNKYNNKNINIFNINSQESQEDSLSKIKQASINNTLTIENKVAHKTLGNGIVKRLIGPYAEVMLENDNTKRLIHKSFLTKIKN